MWVAKYRKDWGYCLWNRKPEKVSDEHNEWRLRNDYFYELEYDNQHSMIELDRKYDSMFDGMDFPVEVELVRDDENPMFYAQAVEDRFLGVNVYLSTRLEYRYRRPYRSFILFGVGFGRMKKGNWHVSKYMPEGLYTDLTVNVPTDSHRIRPKDFAWKPEDGYVPVSLKIKKDI